MSERIAPRAAPLETRNAKRGPVVLLFSDLEFRVSTFAFFCERIGMELPGEVLERIDQARRGAVDGVADDGDTTGANGVEAAPAGTRGQVVHGCADCL